MDILIYFHNLEGLKNVEEKTIDDILQNFDENLLSMSIIKNYQNNNYQLMTHQHLNDYVYNLISKKQGQNCPQNNILIKKKLDKSNHPIFRNSENTSNHIVPAVNYIINNYLSYNYYIRHLLLRMEMY